MMQVDYPFHFDPSGRTARTSEADHVRDLIAQVLFTSPGERVNRPDFGSGLKHLVFGPNSDEMAAAIQFTVKGALQQWLGHLIQVEEVSVNSREATLQVSVQYINTRTQQRHTVKFLSEGMPG